MDKIIDISELTKKSEDKTPPSLPQKASNPIVKKLAKFTNEKLTAKFDINDLLR